MSQALYLKNHRFIWILSLILLLFPGLLGCQYLQKSKMEKDFVNTRIKIVKSKIDNGDLMGAQYDLEPLLLKFPDHSELLTLSGFVDITLGNHKRALDTMLKAHDLEETPGSYLNLSSAYIASGDFPRALRAIEEGITLGEEEKYPNLGRFYHNRGYIEEMTGKHQKAIKSYEQALYYLPGYLQTLHRLSHLLDVMGHKQKAIPYYRRYSYFCKTCFQPMERLTLYYLSLGDKQVAEKLVKNYLKNPAIAEEDKFKAESLEQKILSAKISQMARKSNLEDRNWIKNRKPPRIVTNHGMPRGFKNEEKNEVRKRTKSQNSSDHQNSTLRQYSSSQHSR